MQIFGWKSINTNLLRISSSDEYIVPQAVEDEGPIRILKQDYIDFNILKGWISLCRDLHANVCAVEDPSSVPFLKMIDCETRKIIPAVICCIELRVGSDFITEQFGPGVSSERPAAHDRGLHHKQTRLPVSFELTDTASINNFRKRSTSKFKK